MGLSVVPSWDTQRLVEQMIHDAHRSSGGDAALEHFAAIPPSQMLAVVGELLSRVRGPGRAQVQLRLSGQDRREAHRLYARGDRNPSVVDGEREYQRLNKRDARRRKAAAA